MIRILTSTILAAAALISSAPAFASDAPASKTISYIDLDLSHSAGMKALQFRVNAAIRSVCGDPDQRDLEMVQISRRCRLQAQASTNSQIALAVNKQRQTATRATGVEIANR
jgi:UrcA family protein